MVLGVRRRRRDNGSVAPLLKQVDDALNELGEALEEHRRSTDHVRQNSHAIAREVDSGDRRRSTDA